MFFRSVTPPNTPQRARNAARQQERDQRIMNTPQHRRIPAPLLNPPAPAPAPFDDPFLVAPAMAPVALNGQVYHNLPPELAAQVAALQRPPSPAHRGRGRGRGQGVAVQVAALQQ